MNNTLSLPTLPATYAAALSPSTLRNSDSSLIATGEITGVSPCLSNNLINSEFTFLILPVYPPSIACFLPFSFTISNFFFLSATMTLASTPDNPIALIPFFL